MLYNFVIGSTVVVVSGTAAAKSLQSCPTLCDPTDGSPPGSEVPGILQARILEWVAISFSIPYDFFKKYTSLFSVLSGYIYLAASDLSCSTQGLHYIMWIFGCSARLSSCGVQA